MISRAIWPLGLQDLLEALRPGLARLATYEEAAAAVAEIEAAEAEAGAAGEESDASESDPGSDVDGGARCCQAPRLLPVPVCTGTVIPWCHDTRRHGGRPPAVTRTAARTAARRS